MKKGVILTIIIVISVLCSFKIKDQKEYTFLYLSSVKDFKNSLGELMHKIDVSDISTKTGIDELKKEIGLSRLKLKSIDFWLRYFEPVGYMKINGPLPVEWETEVFEKFEKPYRREGAGLSLAEIYLNRDNINKDSLHILIQHAIDAVNIFQADSITDQLDTYHHFFLCNRLYLLNLSSIYTTGFECPGNNNIVPELKAMLPEVRKIYTAFNTGFSSTSLSKNYLDLYDKLIAFVNTQPDDFTAFDHFTFIKDYINPLFSENQRLINQYAVVSKNFNDYTLNNDCYSIFGKSLYAAQNTKGVYSLVEDENTLNEIKHIGKLLFYDPILSGNNSRSCASCHKPSQYFTDTTVQTSLQFNGQKRLPRNVPTLINVIYNHLLMLDGKHTSLQDQARGVISNPKEMNCSEKEVLEKVLSCDEYKDAFKKFLKLTPEEKKISFDHIISAITFYYGGFSDYYSPFDDAMNKNMPINNDAKKGFNLFMGKAQCGTCHFVPHFNGVKPPFVNSEFEVLGVPEDLAYKNISPDSGRFDINPAKETWHAFRTGSIRNAEFTKPYMHNGVFNTLDEVMDFYNAGGGVGKKLIVDNQTLSSDSLKLDKEEIRELMAFIHSLNEKIIFEEPPAQLPLSHNDKLNHRKVGGTY
ncbi:MAG: cytochrome C peroxidase [Bacteroidetes bacterium]|nr:cytochrome C peroxidase [Bacteroidota bacterium]